MLAGILYVRIVPQIVKRTAYGEMLPSCKGLQRE